MPPGEKRALLAEAGNPASDRWYGKLGLLLVTVLLLTLAFAPMGQFYLAWVGLVPWLLVLRRLKSQRAAFLWSWLAGVIFFTANMWWLWNVTGPGMAALMVVLGLYWGAAAVVLRGATLLGEGEDGGWRMEDGGEQSRRLSLSSILHLLSSSSVAKVLLIAATWTSFEWLRGNWPLNGLPWLFLGHSQTPVLALCQVADVAGVYGITFWIASVNALVALFVLSRFHFRPLVPAAAVVAGMFVLVLGYGVFRLNQTQCLSQGPSVLVLQPNYPQDNTGEKSAAPDELVVWHVLNTRQALRDAPVNPDLAIWSETMMPELNIEARRELKGTREGDFIEEVHGALSQLAQENEVALLAGGVYGQGWKRIRNRWVAADRRNTAYFYDRQGRLSDDPADRYDKIHIVPFGEYLPFRQSAPPLYKLFTVLSPYPVEYFLTPGEESAMTVFRLPSKDGQRTYRFVTPICFEDIDPILVAKMFRARTYDKGDRGKAADFIVNITNDGWFLANQMPQHLQAARFRSIENRAPTARSVNTGISGFIDSCGRVSNLIPAGTEGSRVQTLQLDSRLTLYTRWGDVFALLCAAATLLTMLGGAMRWRARRRPPDTGTATTEKVDR
jgi:apolipoprotein N-acyltransferase